MNINGKWYTEPQIEAYVTELENKVAELEAKHWNECRQIAHYDDERKKIREYLQHSAKTMTVHGVLEALALIGEDTNVPASADDTNVGDKIDSWISCKDRLPNHYEEVLVVSKLENKVYFAWYDADISMFIGHSHMRTTRAVTHWMPLPEPPKDGDTNG